MNGTTQTIGATTGGSLQDLFGGFIGFIPEIIAAVVVMIAGIILAKIIAGLVRRLLKFTKIDEVGRDMGAHRFLKQRGIDFSFTNSVASLVKWVLLLVFFVAAVDILGINQMSGFISSIVGYIPNVIVAVAMLSIGFIAAHYLSELAEDSARLSPVLRSYAAQLGVLAYVAIISFALMASLVQLGIAVSLITIIFAGFVGMLAIAGGLAFGLGGRESAKRLLDKIEREAEKANQAPQTEFATAKVSSCLAGMEYPAKKDEVISYCKDSRSRSVLEKIPEKEYFSLSDVMHGLKRALGRS